MAEPQPLDAEIVEPEAVVRRIMRESICSQGGLFKAKINNAPAEIGRPKFSFCWI